MAAIEEYPQSRNGGSEFGRIPPPLLDNLDSLAAQPTVVFEAPSDDQDHQESPEEDTIPEITKVINIEINIGPARPPQPGEFPRFNRVSERRRNRAFNRSIYKI